MTWIKSTYSADKPQCCVEARVTYHHGREVVEVRDSKLGTASPRERFTPREWRAFCKAAPSRQPAADRMYRVGDLAYSRDEWHAFVRGVAVGEFTLGRLRSLLALTGGGLPA